jgi:hypothetical protein
MKSLRKSWDCPTPSVQLGMLHFGSRGTYDWLVSDEHRIDDLLTACPEFVLKKYVAVTSCDSGPLSVDDDRKAAGWHCTSDIAYSSKVQTIDALPRAMFDEWYIFPKPTDLGELLAPDKNPFEVSLRDGLVCAFVNFGGFSLSRHEMKDPADMFWKQLERIHPESYVADGNYLNFVSSGKNIFATVREALRTPR